MRSILSGLLLVAATLVGAGHAQAASPLYEGPLASDLQFSEDTQSNADINAIIHSWRAGFGDYPRMVIVDISLVQQETTFTGVGRLDVDEATDIASRLVRNGTFKPQGEQLSMDVGGLNFRLMRMSQGSRASCVVFRRYSSNNMVDVQETTSGAYGMGHRKFFGVYCELGADSPLGDNVLKKLVDGLRPPG